MIMPSFAGEPRVRATNRFGSPAQCLAHNVRSARSSTALTRRYRVLLPFIKEGFECGQKAFYIVDPKLREEHLQRLESVGIDVAATEQSGQFKLRA